MSLSLNVTFSLSLSHVLSTFIFTCLPFIFMYPLIGQMSDLQDLMEKIEVKEKRSLQSSKNFATAQQMDQVAKFSGKNKTMI